MDQFKVDMIQETMEDGMKPLFAIFSEKDEEKKVSLVKFLIFKNFLKVILQLTLNVKAVDTISSF